MNSKMVYELQSGAYEFWNGLWTSERPPMNSNVAYELEGGADEF
jgi:hypothetical protein